MKRIDFQKHIVMSCITFSLLIYSFSSLLAQTEFKGQALGKNINTEYDEMVPRLSPNGQRMYFSRLQHPSNVGGRNSGQDIWFSDRLPDGTWAPAQNAGASINNKHHNSVGGIATGEKILFLANTYDADPLEVRPGISFTKMGASTWEMPQTIFGPSVISDMGKTLDFFVTPDQKYMLISMTEKGKVKPDIFVSTRIEEGLYSLPKSLGDIINFPNSAETTPSLSQDTKMLFFTSDVEGGMGSGDIYFSERLDDSWINWSEPQSMGPEVNTAGYDGHFVMGYDGMYAYFVSGKTPTANGDIYEVELRHLNIFKDDLPDTLQVFATAGKALSLDMDKYGINAQNVRLIGHRWIDGLGKVQLRDGATNFEYVPPADYDGTDRFEFLICDPPQSDDCKRVVVVAAVDNGAIPVVVSYQMTTKQNVPVTLDATLPQWSQSRTVGAYEGYPGTKGKLATSSSIGQGNLIYTPAKDFVGTDSIPVLGPCPDGFSSNCLKAVILVEVEPVEVAAVVEPIIEEPVVVIDPIVEVPIIEEPVVVVDPIVEEPVIEEPVVVVDPIIEAPIIEAPVVVIDPIIEEPIIEEPVVVVDPIVEEPIVVIDPIIEEPTIEEPSAPSQLQISGHILDDPSGFPLEAEIVFYENEKEVGRTQSDAVTGAFAIELPNGRDYAYAIEQDYYFPVSGEIKKGKAAIKGQVDQEIRLLPIPLEAGQTFVLKHIYFDIDKSILKPDSKAELIRLQDLMRRNPNMEIEVRGHTDSQSDDAHNQALSESRAAAVINYLKYQGVMGYRLSSKGYGETMPISSNETEEGRSLNRRVEFYIKKM